MSKLRVALMGCGRISERHAEVLTSKRQKNFNLIAVCDSNVANAKLLGGKYGVPYYSSINSLVNSESVDIVSVLTESGNHCDHVLQVASLGKHAVVEKPMALTLPDADKMINKCAQMGVKLFVVKQNRHNLPVVIMIRLTGGAPGKWTVVCLQIRRAITLIY